MRRIMLGWIIIVHALAHAYAGVWSAESDSVWAATVLSSTALLAYLFTGLGVLRVPVLRDRWKLAMVAATASSIVLIVWYRPPWGMIGIALDVALLLLVLDVQQRRIDADIAVVDALGAQCYRHPAWARIGWTLATIGFVYAAAAMLLRPVFLRWGTTPEERTAALPGDEVLPSEARYRIDHAITIHVPASAIWPWLVQLGQDRGGFYSYDWLERSVGDHIENADRVHPEWQRRAVGDTIMATQRDYLGGRFGTLGWRVTTVEPNRVIGLENWGTFVLRPTDSATTRLIVRTRGSGEPSIAAFLAAPLNVFVFEPAHFIMERGMLRGIRRRAESAARSVAAAAREETAARPVIPHKKTTNTLPAASAYPDRASHQAAVTSTQFE